MTTPHVLDGRARFNCSLEEFYRQPIIVSKIARKGLLIPLPTDVDETAPPALARIDPADGHPRWIADCPDCRSAEYVWLDAPVFFCCNCANATVGGRWRLVVLPTSRGEIEALVLARPPWIVIDGKVCDPRSWYPVETLEMVRARTAELLEASA